MSFTGIMERSQLKNILQFTHALREKDRDYLPDKLEDWQMQAYLCMIKQAFWYVMISKEGAAIPKYVKMGNLPNLYETSEAEQIYLHAQRAQKEQLRKGAFSKNDFFELLMVMIPNE